MILIQLLLLPFSLLYFIGVGIRNYLYDRGLFKSTRFDLKTIGVGNLRVGGTGKTPHVEYLVKLLKEKYSIATLSRGYGRKTSGFVMATEGINADSIGDEPMQFFLKFGNSISVAVGEKRLFAIPEILFRKPEINLILLDDIFQHRSVSPHINILLTEYSKPFYNDLVLPSGRLRESRKGARRADIIIVTKCPDDLSGKNMERTEKGIRKYSSEATPVFFTGLKYEAPLPVFNDGKIMPGKEALLVSGIANSEVLENKVKKDYKLIKHLSYSDHYEYSTKTMVSIVKQFHEAEGNDKFILLTEKDMVKWKKTEFEKLLSGIPVFYLPIEVYFLKDKLKFDTLISERLEE